MNESVQFNSHVGDDGVLSVNIDLGRTEAKKEVIITIQPKPENALSESSLSWPEFLERTYGSCHGLGLERHDQGDFEQREPIQ